MSNILSEIANKFHKITKGKFSSVKSGQIQKVSDPEWLQTMTGDATTAVTSVVIQDLPLKAPPASKDAKLGADYWITKSKEFNASRAESDAMSRQFGDSKDQPPQEFEVSKDKCIFYQSKIGATHEAHVSGFFESLYHAYSNHGEVVLSPDDVWTMIQLSFTRFVNQGGNAEKLRAKFVSHEGKKRLEVWDPMSWNDFVTKVIPLIKGSTHQGVLDDVMPTFSTTTEFEQFISSVITMDTFKAYFEYAFEISCGITKVHFLGSLQDWQSLPLKLKGLRKYALCGEEESRCEWAQYVDRLVPVLQQFVETYQGKVNVDWWQQVICEEHEVGYGFKPASLTGWATNFVLGAQHVKYVSDVPNLVAQVPVFVNNNPTDLWCGFSGIQVYKGRVYRPQVSIGVLGAFNPFSDPSSCQKSR